ncbi:MAG: MEDS domain-containing protein [Alphaproteobacteria bacterium]|nr:MEDS domain-containing protein [Alphaproteobacteria bacterium]MBV9692470.1 MEDS domain-containing protein [Alphaproteobacteria bacterium]
MSERHAFWAEMSACEHFVQVYEADDVFMDTLTGFVAGALRQDEGAVVIATPNHLHELKGRLDADGLDADAAIEDDDLLLLDAEQTLAQFMVDGWPEQDKFRTMVRGILARAGRGGRRVRAFGEMVAVMWAKGHCAATVRLEHLWQQMCEQESFVLFCAYPKSGFTENPVDSIARVCAQHSKVFPAGI